MEDLAAVLSLDNQTIDDFDIDYYVESVLNDTIKENVHIDFNLVLESLDGDSGDATTSGYNLIFMAPNVIFAINATLFIIGLLGNIIACIVILRGKNIFTATNYYLLNLSISDVSVLITRAPFEMYISYFHREIKYINTAICFLHYLSFQTAVNVSTLTVTVFTVERYLAICHPFVAKSLLEISQVKKIIALIWLVAALFAFSPFVLDGFNFEYWDPEYCAIDYDDKYALIFSTVFFFIPTALIATMYVLIGIKLKSAADNKQLGVRENRDTGKTIRMLALIVIAFVLCWAPYYAMEILTPRIVDYINDLVITGVTRPLYKVKIKDISWDDFEYEHNTSYICMQIVRWLIFIKRISCTLAPTVNPIIYTMMSKNFRVALKELLCGRHRTGSQFRSSTSHTKSTTSSSL